jgi:hypothetical protein
MADQMVISDAFMTPLLPAWELVLWYLHAPQLS